ncbi:hypothetical protein BDY21DRAFT_149909 [Lineolata rhizophorae]|uniref:Uncharacterized protein n=1 Tax=Lineolata rhizophorae TaxID=578093 RepID=A0A6A6NN24_9PEZI|nr:hypothetical protein BDY21DRAFT_149909 [Lineolata rhizophorae]
MVSGRPRGRLKRPNPDVLFEARPVMHQRYFPERRRVVRRPIRAGDAMRRRDLAQAQKTLTQMADFGGGTLMVEGGNDEADTDEEEMGEQAGQADKEQEVMHVDMPEERSEKGAEGAEELRLEPDRLADESGREDRMHQLRKRRRRVADEEHGRNVVGTPASAPITKKRKLLGRARDQATLTQRWRQVQGYPEERAEGSEDEDFQPTRTTVRKARRRQLAKERGQTTLTQMPDLLLRGRISDSEESEVTANEDDRNDRLAYDHVGAMDEGENPEPNGDARDDQLLIKSDPDRPSPGSLMRMMPPVQPLATAASTPTRRTLVPSSQTPEGSLHATPSTRRTFRRSPLRDRSFNEDLVPDTPSQRTSKYLRANRTQQKTRARAENEPQSQSIPCINFEKAPARREVNKRQIPNSQDEDEEKLAGSPRSHSRERPKWTIKREVPDSEDEESSDDTDGRLDFQDDHEYAKSGTPQYPILRNEPEQAREYAETHGSAPNGTYDLDHTDATLDEELPSDPPSLIRGYNNGIQDSDGVDEPADIIAGSVHSSPSHPAAIAQFVSKQNSSRDLQQNTNASRTSQPSSMHHSIPQSQISTVVPSDYSPYDQRTQQRQSDGNVHTISSNVRSPKLVEQEPAIYSLLSQKSHDFSSPHQKVKSGHMRNKSRKENESWAVADSDGSDDGEMEEEVTASMLLPDSIYDSIPLPPSWWRR